MYVYYNKYLIQYIIKRYLYIFVYITNNLFSDLINIAFIL